MRERAVNAAESPADTLLKTKIMGALGGAMFGAAAVVALAANGSTPSPNPYWVLLAVAIGARGGFVVGDVLGTLKGVDEASGAVRARRNVFARCMSERGYQVEP